jgi:hypothetical protein
MSGRMARALERGTKGGVTGWARGVTVMTAMDSEHAMARGKAAPAA